MAYRTKEEVQEWATKNNPVARFRKYLELKKWWSKELDQSTRDEAREQVLAEFATAEQQKKPSIQEMFTDVYDELPWNLKEQQEELKQLLKENPGQYPLDQYVESETFLK